jgi:hypothetical protein
MNKNTKTRIGGSGTNHTLTAGQSVSIRPKQVLSTTQDNETSGHGLENYGFQANRARVRDCRKHKPGVETCLRTP